MKTSLRFFVLLFSFFILHPSAFPQGSLTPPGAPAPTMKTLDQLDGKLDQVDSKTEKRTPIDAAHTPGDSGSLFIISAPGSYYLTGNITGVAGKNGISISANAVTIDLNGFLLLGANRMHSGIITSGALANIRIHNGTVGNWYTGIDCNQATNSQFDHLRVSNNEYGGVDCGKNNVLGEISAAGNNIGGISTGDNCTITASTAVANEIGIGTGNQCIIIGCTAVSGYTGIYLSDKCTIKDCTASLNVIGITAGNNCQIISNDASGNRREGIFTTGTNNRIDSNHCIGNASYGIRSFSTADFIMRNTCTANGGTPVVGSDANYSPNTGAYFGPLSKPSNATSAWANF